MKQPKDIAYVDLVHDDPVTLPPSFLFRRFDHETFRPPDDLAPHRHNYHEIFVVQSGYGQHRIDDQVIELVPCTVSLITRGQVHIVEHLTDFTGWLVRFGDDFLPSGVISTEVISPSEPKPWATWSDCTSPT